MDDLLALLMLAELPHVGERVLARIQKRAREKGMPLGDVVDIPETVLAEEYDLPADAVARLCTYRAFHERHCRALSTDLAAAGVVLTWPGHATYPARWTRRRGMPPLAFLHGNIDALNGPTLGILCSRTITDQTVSATVQIAQCAHGEHFTLITGGMKTTHRIAAVAVRATGAAHAIVLDRGLFASFGRSLDRDPFGFGPGRARFNRCRTLAVSPFRPHDHASPHNGRRRDELIAATADILVATSARPGGETERICLQALDEGQCVLSWQAESAALIAAGATAIDEGDLRAGLRRFLSPTH